MYKVSGVVEVPGPPLVSAMTESKTLSVPLMLKIKDDSRTGRGNREDDTADQVPGIGAVDPRRFQDVLRYFQQPGVQQHAVKRDGGCSSSLVRTSLVTAG
jgi:hypothetical protein